MIDEWLGHSTKVAEKHYLLVTDDHWVRAIDSGVHIPADREPLVPITVFQKQQNPSQMSGLDGVGELLIAEKIPPAGIEPAA